MALPAGGVGGVATAIPFVSTFQPSERARAAGAAVEVDISALAGRDDDRRMARQTRLDPRAPEQLAALDKIDGQLADPVKSERKPSELTLSTAVTHRSIKPDVLVAVGICTHLGCSPSSKFQSGPQASAR